MKHFHFILLLLLPLTLLFSCEKIEIPGEDTSTDKEGTINKPNDDTHFTELDYYSVAQLQAEHPEEQYITVRGYIVGYATNTYKNAHFSLPTSPNTNMLLADDPAETNCEKCVTIQLTKTGYDIRSHLNLYDHPELFHQYIEIKGTCATYLGTIGIKPPDNYDFPTEEETDNDADATPSDTFSLPSICNVQALIQGGR